LFFVMGFWLLDFSNNTVQGPARALMADLAGSHGPSTANAIFVSWMAIGNILGYSSGSTDKWHTWFPFLQTRACCEACANLKAAFLVSVVFLGLSTVVTMIFAREVPLDPAAAAKQDEAGESSGPFAVFKGMKNMPPGMPQVLIVTGLTWLSWFPFILFDTDWMGREMYHGRPDGSPEEVARFQEGVRQGAFGLLLNSVVLGASSFLIEPMCRKLTAKVVWVMSSFLVCVAMALVTVLSSWSLGDIGGNVQDAAAVDKGLKTTALAIFVFLGFPFAVLCSVPFAVTAQLAAAKGGGQGAWWTRLLSIDLVALVDRLPTVCLCIHCRAVHGGPQHLHRGATDGHRHWLWAVGRAVRQGQHPGVRARRRLRLHRCRRRDHHAAKAAQDQLPVRLHGRRALMITTLGCMVHCASRFFYLWELDGQVFVLKAASEA
jgi:solute carrier family 45, member 1/2/4